MKTDRRQHLQDIYSSNNPEKEESYQISSKAVTGRQRELRKRQLTTTLVSLFILGLVIGLTYAIILWQKSFQDTENVGNDVGTKYLSRSGTNLDDESDWVMDYPEAYADPAWDGDGERPLSTYWIKKAAYNLHWAETAAKYYEQALEIFPEIENVKVPLADVYLQLERFDDAIALLETVPKSELSSSSLNNMGVALTTAEKYEQAEACLKQALEKEPDYADAMKNLATLYKKQNIPAKAIEIYERYLTAHKDDPDNTRHSYALYLVSIQNWKLAVEQLRTLTKEFPAEAPNYQLLAEAEKQLGNTAAALAALERYSQLTASSIKE
jgi:tetratricopeptide (TPR) repeat protein